MTEPLALVLYERLLPGTQLVSRLQDLRYRVKTLNDPTLLASIAGTEKAMLVLADLEPRPDRIREAVARLKSDPATAHIPVVVFAPDASVKQHPPRVEGATLVVSETAILSHLPQLLEQALQVE